MLLVANARVSVVSKKKSNEDPNQDFDITPLREHQHQQRRHLEVAKEVVESIIDWDLQLWFLGQPQLSHIMMSTMTVLWMPVPTVQVREKVIDIDGPFGPFLVTNFLGTSLPLNKEDFSVWTVTETRTNGKMKILNPVVVEKVKNHHPAATILIRQMKRRPCWKPLWCKGILHRLNLSCKIPAVIRSL